MRRWTTLLLVTPLCWALAAACAGDGGQAPAPEVAPATGASGQVGPGGSSGPGAVGADVVLVPLPQLGVALAGKAIVQDGSYPVGKLTAHASDPKNAATTFHWALIGPGIVGGVFGDGADFSYELPVPTDKSNYVLTVIAKLAGKAVQKDFSFFTVPAPSAKIVANVNQAAGLPVALLDTGAVPKGQKIQFSADAKFANQYKWQISKDGAKAQDLGTSADVMFDTKDIGKYQVALQVWGDGGFSPMQFFSFSVEENAVAIAVITQVTKPDAYAGFLKAGGQYPIGSTVLIDATGIGNALASMSCTIKDAANSSVKPSAQSKDQYQFVMSAAGDYLLNCTYVLKEGYVSNKEPLESVAAFKILPKAVALATVNGQNCNPATALVFEVGSTVTLSAANSTGNISSYSWLPSSGELKDGDKVNASLKLNDVTGYQLNLNTKGIGDSASVSCTIFAQPLPKAVFADDATVKAGRSYIVDSHQRAKAKVTQGIVDAFDWSLVNAAGTALSHQTTQNPSDVFEFLLSETGDLTLKLMSKLMNLSGPSNNVPFVSKLGQVSLITPLDFSNIQSIAAVSDTDVYFASPAAVFHKGADGRVVQVKNISDHPAQPNGFFARHAGDIYLLTTDGGFWRYTFKDGWAFTKIGTGTTQAISGPATATRLFVVQSSRLLAGDVSSGSWTKIYDGSRFVTTLGSFAYAANAASVANGSGGTDPGVVKCSTTSCTALKWQVDAGAVTWKSVGASTSAVYLSTANGRVFTVQNDLVTKLGDLSNDDYVVAFSRAGTTPYAIGNKGGVYRITSTGVVLYYTAPATITAASGVSSTFWAWDDAAKVVMQTEKDNLQTVAAQKALGTPPAECKEQKHMWVVGDVAYMSVCAVPAGKPALYTIWSTPYQGDLVANGLLSNQTPVVGVASDGAGGVLVMRSDGGNTNFIQQQKIDGTINALNVPLDNGETFVGISGKFFITSKGIRVNDGPAYPLVQSVADAHHPAALGDVLIYAYGKDSRLARVDLGNAANTKDLANVDPADPIVDVVMDVNKRVYVLTVSALYRYDNSTTLTKIYTAPAAMMNAMAGMNGHHLLLSMGLKGLVMVDVDGKVAPQVINVSAETPAAVEVTDVSYNGTEFLIYGRDGNGVLQLHEFGAPQ